MFIAIKDASLKVKVIGGISFLLLLLVLFMYLYFPARQNKEAFASRKMEVEQLALILSQSIVTGLEFEDVESVNSILAGVKVRDDLLAVEVLTTAGKTFLYFQHSAVKTDYNNVTELVVGCGEQNTSIVVSQDILSDKQKIGSLKMAFSLSDLSVKSNANKRAILYVGIIVLFLSIFLGVNLAKLILNPLYEAGVMVQELAEGEGDLTKRMKISSKDEIGQFSESFNKFLENLGSLIKQVRDSAEKVAAGVVQVASIAEQSAAGAETQNNRTTQMAASVQEMTTAISENSKSASQTAEKAGEATQQAEEGTRAMSETSEGMDAIVQSVEVTGEIISTLSVKATEIGEIIQVINDIADQTNLLALNAAIEAARAGEQGRGFAVVADEVRKLAERTMSATYQIVETIKAIQTGAKQATVSMDEAGKVVASGKAASAKTGKVLSGIVMSVSEAMDMIAQIAAATEEMSSGADEISCNVGTISTVARESADGADQMARLATVLTEETGGLQNLVAKFKL